MDRIRKNPTLHGWQNALPDLKEIRPELRSLSSQFQLKLPVMESTGATLRISLGLPEPSGDFPRAAIEWTLQNILKPAGIEAVVLPVASDDVDISIQSGTNETEQISFPSGLDLWTRFARGEPVRKVNFVATVCAGQDVPALVTANGKIDLVATAFFFLSGYDERQTTRRDRHGRFVFEGSIADQLDCSKVPVVDYIRNHVLNLLVEKGLAPVRKHSWCICPTVDIDYTKKWRPGIVYREVVQSPLFNIRAESFRERTSRLARSAGQFVTNNRVYEDSLKFIRENIESHGGRGTFFFKGGGADPYDVRYRLSGQVKKFIRSAKKSGHEIGLHPSYWAAVDRERLHAEKKTLESVTGEPINVVRSHYLRWSEQTASMYVAAGFTVDSTLGYSETVGFRRGTCVPFVTFDFESGRSSRLTEHPLIVMESALFNRMYLGVEDAIKHTCELLDHARKVDGSPVVLWHNIIRDRVDCPGWDRHFVEVMHYAVESGAKVTAVSDNFCSE
ncbi:MAG: hypothetical protein HKN43_09175 [Rhodothermales bacterium]|nr:hypothetical protein [Rhodothermales bacterium]